MIVIQRFPEPRAFLTLELKLSITDTYLAMIQFGRLLGRATARNAQDKIKSGKQGVLTIEKQAFDHITHP